MRLEYYFPSNGVFMGGGTYRTYTHDMNKIYDEIKQLIDRRNLPNLVPGHGPAIVRVWIQSYPDESVAYTPKLINL